MSDLIGRFSEVSQDIYSNISSNKNAQSLNLDAEFNLQISFLEALNGAKKNILVNDERIEVKIPQGIETGSKIRIKNKGNIQSGKGKRGGQCVNTNWGRSSAWRRRRACAQHQRGALHLGAWQRGLWRHARWRRREARRRRR